jgi:hypothetical protein
MPLSKSFSVLALVSSLTGVLNNASGKQRLATSSTFNLMWQASSTALAAANVTRFLWVPTIQEFVMPFAVGLIQFSIIQMLTVQLTGPWMVLVAALILTINWIAHSTMRKARLDGDNSEFFTGTTTASWRDFQLAIGSIALLLVYGIYEWVFAPFNAATLSILLITLGLLLVQFRLMAVWWSCSVSTKPSKD